MYGCAHLILVSGASCPVFSLVHLPDVTHHRSRGARMQVHQQLARQGDWSEPRNLTTPGPVIAIILLAVAMKRGLLCYGPTTAGVCEPYLGVGAVSGWSVVCGRCTIGVSGRGRAGAIGLEGGPSVSSVSSV
jgi:hypothetical protein